jgi:hypothetical protein
MNFWISEKTTPTVLLCFIKNANGGRHGCCFGNGLDGPLSTTRAGFHPADVYHFSSHHHRMGAVPLQTDGDVDRETGTGP